MIRWIVVFALLLAGCRNCGETCEACVKQCAPFAVAECVPRSDFILHCRCDPSRRAETP